MLDHRPNFDYRWTQSRAAASNRVSPPRPPALRCCTPIRPLWASFAPLKVSRFPSQGSHTFPPPHQQHPGSSFYVSVCVSRWRKLFLRFFFEQILKKEPVGSSRPRFGTDSKGTVLERMVKLPLTMLCTGQGYPVPSFRLDYMASNDIDWIQNPSDRPDLNSHTTRDCWVPSIDSVMQFPCSVKLKGFLHLSSGNWLVEGHTLGMGVRLNLNPTSGNNTLMVSLYTEKKPKRVIICG